MQKGQLGHGDTIQRDRPTVVSELSKYVAILPLEMVFSLDCFSCLYFSLKSHLDFVSFLLFTFVTLRDLGFEFCVSILSLVSVANAARI